MSKPMRITVPAELVPYLEALGAALFGSRRAAAIHLLRTALIEMHGTPGWKPVFEQVRARLAEGDQ